MEWRTPRVLHRPLVILLLLLTTFAGRAEGPPFPGESASLGRRLEEVARKEADARAGKEALWTEVLDELQGLLNSAPEELAQLDQSRVVQVRRICQAHLARLPAPVLERIRRRIEPEAKKWLDEARRTRDIRLLRRLVEEAFCSESAGKALDLLGDLAFERGEFEEAEHWWRLLAPLPECQSRCAFELRHPDAQAVEARTQAKQLLARWFASRVARREEWIQAVEAFQKRHPRAEGYLAGEKGVLWKRLRAAADSDRSSFPETGDWSTFAGSPTRNRILSSTSLTPEGLARLCREGQSWHFRLSKEIEEEPRPIRTPSEAARSLAFAPIIAGRHVLVADARQVIACDLSTGKRESWFDLTQLVPVQPELRLPAPPDLRYTLTAAGDCILARLGVQELRAERKQLNYIVCLDREPDSKGNRLRWHVRPEEKQPAVFEGTPVVGNGQAYVAVTRFGGNRAVTAIHCYPLTARGVAPLRWKRDVCSTSELPPKEGHFRHHLLTLAGPHLVYCSHAGAVVALDSMTGKLVWGVRYPILKVRNDPLLPAALRDLNPCVYAGGLIYVAPADSDLLLCLEPMTGRIIWERRRIEVTHLLGVARGKVIFSTSTPSAGLRAINAADGGDRGGWFRTGVGKPIHSFGRGLLAGDLVIWPTLHHVYIVRQEDGEQPDDPTLTHRLPPGNLAFGSGAIVVTDREKLHIFAPPRSLFR
jgi:outer membrane protein assembly factor BamB